MSAAIEHVDDAAERLGITVAALRTAVAAGELRFRSALADHLSVDEVTAWGRRHGLIADAPAPIAAPVLSTSSSAAPPASSTPAIDPALRTELERTAKQLGLSVDDVIANARPAGRRVGERRLVRVDHDPRPAASSTPAASEPARAFVEYDAAPTSPPTPARDLEAPIDTTAAIASVADQLELEASEVARSVAPLENGRRRTKVEIDYAHKAELPK